MVLKPQVIEDGGIMLLQRQIEGIPYAANTRTTAPAIRLRPNLLKNIMLHVKIQFTTPAVVGTLNEDWPWRLIQNLTVRSVRNEILKSVDGRSLHWLNNYEMGTPEYSTFIFAPAVSTTYDFSFDLKIPFENFTGINPEETILNLNEFTELYVDIMWSDVDLIYSAVLTEVNVTATIVALEREPVNMSDELEPRKKLIDQVYTLPIRSSSLEYLLPENTLIKTIAVMIIVEGGLGVRIGPDEIANLSIEDDDNAHSLREWSGPQIRSMNKSYYGLEALADGFWVIEFDQLRDLSSLYKTFGINYPKIKFDFTGSPTIPFNPTTMHLFIRQVATPPAIVQSR